MTMTSFVGARKPLDAMDIPRLAHQIDVSEDHLRAFLEVEARSKGFDSKGRPVMLFEPHVFYRCLPVAKRSRAVKMGLARAKWVPGKYPTDSYPRLISAIEIDEDAALKACSIGLSQVLVENHSQVGYTTPQAMWKAFMDDEENHVEAMVRFIVANGIDDDLRAGRWATVARVYNGPRYAENKYDTKMAAAYAKFQKVPDLVYEPEDGIPPVRMKPMMDKGSIKAVQARLIELGYPEVGKVDGTWGSKTRATVLGFRADHNLPLVAQIDEGLLMALMVAEKREVSEERANTTAADLRDAGSSKVIAADKAGLAGIAVTAGGVLTGLSQTVDDLQGRLGEFKGLADSVKPVLDAAMALSPVLLLALGGYVIYQQVKLKRAVVEDYRVGKYVGR